MSREQFDSIVKHHISPIVGMVRLNPDDPSYVDHLNTAYDSIFDDFNKFFEPGDYPETVDFNGVSYSVSVDRDSDGEIQYFQLVDSDGNFFFEMDWAGPIDSEMIVETLEESSNNPSSSVENNIVEIVQNDRLIEVVEADESRKKSIVDDFDFLYSEYSSYPDEFKIEVMDTLNRFSGESSAFRRILVSEAVENWDEFGEF